MLSSFDSDSCSSNLCSSSSSSSCTSSSSSLSSCSTNSFTQLSFTRLLNENLSSNSSTSSSVATTVIAAASANSSSLSSASSHRFLNAYLRQKLNCLRHQTQVNNQLNNQARHLLNNLSTNGQTVAGFNYPTGVNRNINSASSNNNYNRKNSSKFYLSPTKNNYNSASKNNNHNYLNKHANYWQKVWSFNDNPVFEYEITDGFENPIYDSLYTPDKENQFLTNSTESARNARSNPASSTTSTNTNANYIIQYNNQSVMDIYESILDFNDQQHQQQQTNNRKVLTESLAKEKPFNLMHNNCDYEISSPESNDSGIHSDDRLNRHNMMSGKTSADSSLYSSVISSKKSYDEKLSRETSTYSSSRLDEEELNSEFGDTTTTSSIANTNMTALNDCSDLNELNYVPVVHVQQHELPSGWIKCCDESGIYYWHKPSGTVTRTLPSDVDSIGQSVPKKNFDINEYSTLSKNSSSNSLAAAAAVGCSTRAQNKSIDDRLTGSSLSTLSDMSTSLTNTTNRLKNFDADLDDYYQADQDDQQSSSSSSDLKPTKRSLDKSHASNGISKLNVQTFMSSDLSSPLSNSSSSSSSTSSCSSSSARRFIKNSKSLNDNLLSTKSTLPQPQQQPEQVAESVEPTAPLRFYVRSLGWVKINEHDLTPEKSSKAVNKCINDLSRGTKDFNDVVARWGDGKDLYMDLDEDYLLLIDPIDDKLLNKQPITSIRVWGVGRDNGSDNRDFAYVARDKQTKIHMCHVFRCDSAPAKEIANALKETCRRIISEKKEATNYEAKLLKRPNYLPDIAVNNSKVDINLKLKSISYNKDLAEAAMRGATSPSFSGEQSLIVDPLPTPMEEPKKLHYCRYLGNVIVNKPYGIDTLNDAIEKIYTNALDDYKKAKREHRLRRRLSKTNTLDDPNESNKNNDDDDDDDDIDDYECELDDEDNAISFDSLLDLNSERRLGCDVCVSISPSTISVKQVNNESTTGDQRLLFEFRIRYLSFMGISNDVRLCGFIVHCVDNSFRCYGFLCENSCGPLCKTIEAACKLRYQKCLDAHPEAASVSNRSNNDAGRMNVRLGAFGSQIRNIFDSFKTRSLFSNLNFPNRTTKM